MGQATQSDFSPSLLRRSAIACYWDCRRLRVSRVSHGQPHNPGTGRSSFQLRGRDTFMNSCLASASLDPAFFAPGTDVARFFERWSVNDPRDSRCGYLLDILAIKPIQCRLRGGNTATPQVIPVMTKVKVDTATNPRYPQLRIVYGIQDQLFHLRPHLWVMFDLVMSHSKNPFMPRNL